MLPTFLFIKKGLDMYLRILSRITGIVLLMIIVITSLVFVYWYYRPNESHQKAELLIETWNVVNNGRHNAFSDLIYWKGAFYMAYRVSDFHSGSSKSKIVIMSSTDAKKWKELIQLDGNGSDIRDPKFAIVKDRLFVFALKNVHFLAFPDRSAYSFTLDGNTWTRLEDLNFTGWLIWRPRTTDSITWYAPFYWHTFGESYLLKSTDCINWNFVHKLYKGDNTNETEMTFLNDSTLMTVGRAASSSNSNDSPEGFTVISQSAFPYNNWLSFKKSFVTRLDGPTLFTYRGNVYAMGRYQPVAGGITRFFDDLFSRKRTSLFLIKNYELIYLTDILSDGDTSYSGTVIKNNTLYFSYYTSDITKDYPWILGMFNPTSIRIGQLNLNILETFAHLKSLH